MAINPPSFPCDHTASFEGFAGRQDPVATKRAIPRQLAQKKRAYHFWQALSLTKTCISKFPFSLLKLSGLFVN